VKHPWAVRNNHTGDTLSLPPPDPLGESVIIFNGRVVERVRYMDYPPCIIRLSDGHIFRGCEFPVWIIEQLKTGVWRHQA
jgi:hypothetical protein